MREGAWERARSKRWVDRGCSICRRAALSAPNGLGGQVCVEDLNNQGELEEALALYQEALELFTEVRFQYAMSVCACVCIALNRDLIFAGSCRCLRFWLPKWPRKHRDTTRSPVL